MLLFVKKTPPNKNTKMEIQSMSSLGTTNNDEQQSQHSNSKSYEEQSIDHSLQSNHQSDEIEIETHKNSSNTQLNNNDDIDDDHDHEFTKSTLSLEMRDKLLLFGVLLCIVVVIVFGLLYSGKDIAHTFLSVLRWFLRYKYQSLPIFCVVYMLCVVFIFPFKTILSLCAGFFYGPYLGYFVIYFCSLTGCMIAFICGRYICKASMERFIYVFCIRRCQKSEKQSKYDKYSKLFAHLVQNEGFKTVLMIRLSVVPPMGWTNYIFSNTEVSFKNYALATALSRFFGTSGFYVYIGSQLKTLQDIINEKYNNGDTFWYTFTITAVLYFFFFIFLIVLIRKAKVWLKQKEETTVID